jgi:hypothetical protein
MKKQHFIGMILLGLVGLLVAGTLLSTDASSFPVMLSVVAPLAFAGLNSDKLRELRASQWASLEALLQKAEGETRELNEEEVRDRAQYMENMRKLDDEIALVQKVEDRRAIMAAGHINKQTKKQETREANSYSLVKAVREYLSGNLEGLEKEMHDEAIREARDHGMAITGIGVPSMVSFDYEKRDIVAGSSPAVASDPRGFFDSLLARSVFGPDGYNVPVWNDLVGNVPVPGITVASTVGMAATENAAADESSATVAGNTLSPKRITAYTEFSKQLLIQQSVGVDAGIKRDLLRATLAKLEAQIIYGVGSSGEMKGILNVAGIGSVVGGASGAAPDWADIVDLEKEVAIDNADLGMLGYLLNPKVRAKLKQTEKNSSGVVGNFVWDRDPVYPLNGYRGLCTTNVPSNLTKGSNTACSAIIFGNFEDLVIGSWGGALDITVDDLTAAKTAQIVLVVNSYWDMVVRHAQSYAAMLDAIAT